LSKKEWLVAKVGLLSIYNQDWGITRYVDRFLHYFAAEQVVVFAEHSSADRLISPDGERIRRCWERKSTDYRELAEAIEEECIDVLHVNCCYPFFDSSQFCALIDSLKNSGIEVSAHVHDRNAFGSVGNFLETQADAVVVDNLDMRHSAIAMGVPAARVHLLESGVDCLASEVPDNVRELLGIQDSEEVVVTFDFGLPEAKIEDSIAAVYQLQKDHRDLHLYVVQIDAGTGFDGGYAELLKKKVESLHLDHYIHFIEDKASDSSVALYLGAADAVVLSASRPQFEIREALGIALSVACPIIAASDLPFSTASNAAYAVTPQRSLERAMAELLESSELREDLKTAANSFFNEIVCGSCCD
jgi:glycosyltransferase involved in cell wall biosynthesis